jgi:hypothetical protein
MEEHHDNAVNIDTKYAILVARRIITDLQFLDKIRAPLRPELYQNERESIQQVRNGVSKLHEMFEALNY